MKESVIKQKQLIVDAVLELERNISTLYFLLDIIKETDKPEVSVTFEIYGELIHSIHNLSWDSVVINLYWLYDKKGQRGLHWYLEQMKYSRLSSEQKVNEHIEEIDQLKDKLNKVRKFRNKWVGHKDKESFEKPKEFWRKEEKLKLQEVQELAERASKIVGEEFSTSDFTTSGIQKLFRVIDLVTQNSPKLIRVIREDKS